MKRINDTTFKDTPKDNPLDRIQVEVGDSKQPDFKPQVKIMRWNNDVNFSMRAEEHPGGRLEFDGEIVKYITPDYEVHQYDKPDISKDGGFEFEWVLVKKPTSNVLTATIQTKELKFLYQPELTQEEVDEGAERPENVVGSYAVYHKTKGVINRADGMEYKTGKAFHIYRPKVTDANGNETWGDLNIDEDSEVLTVTVDQTWIDNAVYPVVVDPTFGYTTAGGTTSNLGGNSIRINYPNDPGANGTLTSISFYSKGVAQGGDNARGVIYRVSDLALIDFTAETSNLSNDWSTVNVIDSGSVVSGTDYGIGIWIDSTSWSAGYDSNVNLELDRDDETYSNVTDPPSTFVVASTINDRSYSFYATYTSSDSDLKINIAGYTGVRVM